jgi:hypothetical protein
MTILVQDSFNDPNGTSLDAHTPDVDVEGGGWIEWADYEIQSNRAVANGGQYSAVIDAGESDVIVTATMRTDFAGGREVGLVVRASDNTHYWMVQLRPTDNKFWLLERNGGSYTERASSTSVAINIGTEYEVVVRCDGQTITATMDGGNEISYASASFNETETLHGITEDNAVGSEYHENFLVETLAGVNLLERRPGRGVMRGVGRGI